VHPCEPQISQPISPLKTPPHHLVTTLSIAWSSKKDYPCASVVSFGVFSPPSFPFVWEGVEPVGFSPFWFTPQGVFFVPTKHSHSKFDSQFVPLRTDGIFLCGRTIGVSPPRTDTCFVVLTSVVPPWTLSFNSRWFFSRGSSSGRFPYA